MTVEQTVEYLRAARRDFDPKVIYDTDRRGREFCELVIRNQNQPSFPVTVSVTEDGCAISVGQIENVTDCDTMSPDQTLAAIDDIVSDRIIFVLAYRDNDDIGFGTPFFSRIFAITGRNDDMSDEFEKFVDKLSRPLSPFARKFTAMKGRFIITSFSGSINQTITR